MDKQRVFAVGLMFFLCFHDFLSKMIKCKKCIYKEKQYQISMLDELYKGSKDKSVELLSNLQEAAVQNKNIFSLLMDAGKVCSLGEITNGLFEVGGQYRRNM